MFVLANFCLGGKRFPKIGAPPSVLGVPLKTLSPQTHLKSYDCLKCCCWSLECSLECKNGLLGTNFTNMGRNHHRLHPKIPRLLHCRNRLCFFLNIFLISCFRVLKINPIVLLYCPDMGIHFGVISFSH